MDNLGDLQPKGEMRRGIAPFTGTPTKSEISPNQYILNWQKIRAGSVGDVSMAIHMFSGEAADRNATVFDTAVTFDLDGNLVPLGKVRDAFKKGFGIVAANIIPRFDRAGNMGEEQYVSLGINPEISVTSEVDSKSSENGDITVFSQLNEDFVLPNDPELLSKIRLSITSKPKGGE